MKKVLSLLILIVLLTITFTSCDVAKVILGVFDLIEQDNTTNDVDINIGLGGSNTTQHVHTIGYIPAVDATCTSTGLSEGQYCLSCEKILVAPSVIPLREHTEVIDAAVDATCTSTGLTEGKHCGICNKILVIQQVTPVIPHTYTDRYDESCNKCGFIRDAECAHLETETIEGYDSTCTSTGLTDGVMCKKCETILLEQEIIPLQQHTEVIDAAVDATCTSTGLTEGKHCSICSMILVSQNLVPMSAHTESDWIVDVEPTATTKGSKHIECIKCNAIVKIETISKLGSQGLYFTRNEDGQSYMLRGLGTCTDTEIVIPETYNGLPVTKISTRAFSGNDTITSVEIPNSFTIISQSAFADCTSLRTVIIPDSVIEIGSMAFSNCTALTNIVIPDSVTIIGDYAFSDCKSLANIILPDCLTTIGDEAFIYCSSLTKIVIPDSVTNMGWCVFFNCQKSLVIYCEADSMPTGWNPEWNNINYSDSASVIWGYKPEQN